MNPLLREAAASVELGWVMGVMTAVFLAVFLGWAFWAYRPKHRAMMDEIGRMPFMDGGDS